MLIFISSREKDCRQDNNNSIQKYSVKGSEPANGSYGSPRILLDESFLNICSILAIDIHLHQQTSVFANQIYFFAAPLQYSAGKEPSKTQGKKCTPNGNSKSKIENLNKHGILEAI